MSDQESRRIRRKLRHLDYVSELKEGRRPRAQTFRDKTKYTRKEKHPRREDD